MFGLCPPHLLRDEVDLVLVHIVIELPLLLLDLLAPVLGTGAEGRRAHLVLLPQLLLRLDLLLLRYGTRSPSGR